MSPCLPSLRRHDGFIVKSAAAVDQLVLLRRFVADRPLLGRDVPPSGHDSRLNTLLGRQISDSYASMRSHYAVPKHPIVLAHGLFGFSELKVANALPAVQYWHGIRDALVARGATVFTPAVPPSSAIEDRAVELARGIAAAAAQLAGQQPRSGGITVNVVAHSMGGLDARYVISRLQPPEVHVASLTTIATPHRGSAFADYVLRPGAGPLYVPHFYRLLSAAGLGTAAFEQLTRSYMSRSFNPRTPDQPSTRYFSFGAVVDEPPVLSPFRVSQRVIAEAEGPNDGLVSVESARWGEYKGTLMGVSHLDLINWTNRVKWTFKEWLGWQRDFNAVSFYLDIMDMLAREGL